MNTSWGKSFLLIVFYFVLQAAAQRFAWSGGGVGNHPADRN